MIITTTSSTPRLRSPFAVIWTRDDCARLAAAGVLDYRYELVAGEIIKKVGQNLPHRTSITLITAWLCSIFGAVFFQSQATIDVAPEDNPTSEPEPDVTVLSVPLPELARQNPRQNPTPEHIRLVIEVADTTLDYDLSVKAGLYARAGIPEYWVLDLRGRRLRTLRQPADGSYGQTTEYAEGDSAAPLAAPPAVVRVADLLP
jgi:Uma2 family endonuclease